MSTTTLQVGSAIRVTSLGLPGRWSVWSRTDEILAGYFLTPLDDAARATGIKYAVVQAVMGRAAAEPKLTLVRTDPPERNPS